MNYIPETPAENENFDDANFKEQWRLEELFKRLKIIDFKFTDREGEKAFERYDASFEVNDVEYVVEAKVRNAAIESYKTHYLLEEKSINLYQYHKQGKKILYIQLLTDGAIIYNLSNRFKLLEAGKVNHQLESKMKMIANNTMKDRGKSLKAVVELAYDENLKDRRVDYKINPLYFLNYKLL